MTSPGEKLGYVGKTTLGWEYRDDKDLDPLLQELKV